MAAVTEHPKVMNTVGRIISYAVHYNNVNPPRVIFSGSLAITSDVPAGQNVDAHSLYQYIRETAIEAAKNANKHIFDEDQNELFSVVITNHFYP